MKAASPVSASCTPVLIGYMFRTLVFYLWLATFTMVWCLVCFVIGIFLPLKIRNYFVLVFYCQVAVWSARLICGIRWQVKGLENIPRDGRGYVLLSKHQSTWETFFLPTAIAPHVQVVKKELLYLPFFGWALNLIHPIFIDRKQKTNALKQVIQQGTERLNDGIHVLVFPEGTRIPPGKHKDFSKGGAMLASKANAPVLAIAHNSGEHWPNDHWVKKPGTIRVVISPAIETSELTTNEINAWSEHWINSEVDRISSNKFAGDKIDAENSGKRF